MALLQQLFSSKKFLVLLTSVIGLLITKVFKIQADPSTIMEFVVLIGGYLIGQGISDHGKAAAQVQAIERIQTDQQTTPAEKIDVIKSA